MCLSPDAQLENLVRERHLIKRPIQLKEYRHAGLSSNRVEERLRYQCNIEMSIGDEACMQGDAPKNF